MTAGLISKKSDASLRHNDKYLLTQNKDYRGLSFFLSFFSASFYRQACIALTPKGLGTESFYIVGHILLILILQ